MAQKILAPLDGSAVAHSVLPHIVAYTRVNGTEVTLVHVLGGTRSAHAQVDPIDWQLDKAEAQASLEGIASRLQSFDLTVETDVLEGPAADRIIEYAQKNEFDLIALSSHGQSGLSGWPISSVAQKIIQRSRKSIMLAPAYRPNMLAAQDGDWGQLHYRRILVPLDGSQRAEFVLNKASMLARFHEAELLLVHVVTPPQLLQRMPYTEEDHDLINRVVERNQREAERYFDQLRARLPVGAQPRILKGAHVATALHNLICEEEVDLLILSAHGHLHEHRWPYGPLTTHLLAYSAVPTVVFQDLPAHEIEATHAERMTQATEHNAPPRLNSPELVLA